MQFPFDEQLAKDLGDVKKTIAALRQSLYQSGHGCVCDREGSCGHHASIANELSQAIESLDLAIAIARAQE